MNSVEPIRDPRKIVAIKNMLKGQDRPRDYLLFTLGLNTALRIGDLLKLKVRDVLDEEGRIRDHIYLRESKTGREKRITLNRPAKEALEFYFSKAREAGLPLDLEEPLFQAHRSGRPLDRTMAYKLIRAWAEAVGLTQGKYGTHTLRKTWGYQARKQGVPIELIQAKLGHRSPSVTKRYIGITDEEIGEIESRVEL